MNDEIEDKLKTKVTETGFSVPDLYFSQLSERIQTRVSLEKIKDQSIQEGFEVPAQYFQQLEAKIKEKTTGLQPRKTKIYRLWHSDLLKYAAAACFVLVSAFGLYIANQQNSPAIHSSAEVVPEQTLFDIDEQMIIDHIQASKHTKTSTNASEKELEDYILTNYSQNDIASNL